MSNHAKNSWRAVARAVKLFAVLGAISTLAGCGLLFAGVALTGLGVAVVGVGTYEAVRLTGRAASNAVVATGDVIGGVADRTRMRLSDVAEAGGDLGEKIFSGGALTFELNDDVYHVWNATTRALYAMNFSNVDSEYDALSGWATAQTIDERDVRVDLRQISEYRTGVTIRVGLRGDEDASRLIFEKIASGLGYAD